MSQGVRAIALYKTTKAALQLGLALLLCVLWPLGLPEKIRDLCVTLRQHVTHGWALQLAALLERGSAGHGIALSIAALGLDGTLTAVEAWALRSGRRWGPWLVVVTTGSLLPFELYELARSPRLSRALLILVNAAIVAYLARRARRERQKKGRLAE
jgi:uncharacterized membrane protein (DUF2068 family)